MFVLDTNTLIYFFKGLGNVASHLFALSPQDIGIPAIVLFELEFGIKKSTSPSKRIQQLKELTQVVTILPFGEPEAVRAAHIRFQLEKKGMPIGPYDALIGAIALHHHAVLVTHNTKESRKSKD